MSFLNFLFRDRADKDDAVAPVALEEVESSEVDAVDHHEEVEEASDAEVVEVASVAMNEDLQTSLFEPAAKSGDGPVSTDLESIRAALLKIAEIIHDDEDEEEEVQDSGPLSVVELTGGQIADLIPGVFKASAASEVASDRTFGVRVADLFEQLRTGKVLTSMNRVLTEIPPEWLARPAQAVSREEVSIPLHLAVSAVRADELVKRTPTVERNPELKDMPNLFSMGGPPKAAPKTETIFGAIPPRPLETTVKEPLPASTMPGKDMFERPAEAAAASKPTPAPASPKPAAGPAPKGFVFEFNEAATPFRRADEVKEEVASEPPAAAFAPATPQAPQPPPSAEAEPPAAAFANPFAPMADAAPLFAPAAKEEPPADEPVPAPAMPPPPAPEPVAKAPVAPPPAKPLSVLPGAKDAVRLHGLDLNAASADELAERVPGVGVRMAARIIRYRSQQGPFTCIQDLVNVPGIGPSTYEKITGASWSEARDELRRTLDHLLGGSGVPDLRLVAGRFAQQAGFSGCILVHKDGHVLAADWPDDKQEIVGAIAPQIFKKVSPYADQLGFGEVNPITLCFGEDVLTLVYSGDILIGTLHEIARLDKTQLRLIQLAGAELEDRMDRAKQSQEK